ncbi:hypothetical protein BT93_G0936 [Corymbia citriodora subsp. variegata]|nr:hypothetical protein BT93_G0936 [Corymbia citriodora subsp. variegata]
MPDNCAVIHIIIDVSKNPAPVAESPSSNTNTFDKHNTRYLQALGVFPSEKSSQADSRSTLSCRIMRMWCLEKLNGCLCIMVKGIKAKSLAPREYLHSS